MLLCAGLLTATVASRIHRAAQPALLYLVPFTLLPLLTMAYLKVRQTLASCCCCSLLTLHRLYSLTRMAADAFGVNCAVSLLIVEASFYFVASSLCCARPLLPCLLSPPLTSPVCCAPQGDLRRMWSEPFHTKTNSSRFLEV